MSTVADPSRRHEAGLREKMLNEPHDVQDPALVACAFAETMRSAGYRMDFSLESLRNEVDELLDSLDFSEPSTPEQRRAEASLQAYVGEALARRFNGQWQGTFRADHAGVNFYNSWLSFGEYAYRPAVFLAYRISNGAASTGTFASHLDQVIPLIEQRLRVDRN